MKPSKGMAWAVAGVSIGILGLAIALLGVVIALEGSMNIGPTAFLGIAIAAGGMLVAFDHVGDETLKSRRASSDSLRRKAELLIEGN